MPKRKSLVRPRTIAYVRQSGLCFYCNCPMYSGDPHAFAEKYDITLTQAKVLQCTGEHLEAHRDGGTAAQLNIAAACRFCNQQRHRRKAAPSPDRYKQLVSKRMAAKRWHQSWVFQKILPALQLNGIAL